MRDQGIAFSREHEMPIYYKGQPIGTRRVDFLVEGVISVELKAIIKLEEVHLAQAINYLEAYDLEIGLLINFGSKSMEFKRVRIRSSNKPIRVILKSLKIKVQTISLWLRKPIQTKN